jgi:general stress protein 26
MTPPLAPEVHDYEQVSVYGLDPGPLEELLASHAECTFNWSTRDGWPVGVIMSYLWKNERFWLTAGAHRHRIEAVLRDPRVSIVVTSTGTRLGAGKSATAKGRCVVHEDRATKAWFYPEFARHLYRDPAAAEAFAKFLDSPLRVVLEVEPTKWITYDGAKMFLDSAGKLPPEARTPPKSSDAVRLRRELERRRLT